MRIELGILFESKPEVESLSYRERKVLKCAEALRSAARGKDLSKRMNAEKELFKAVDRMNKKQSG